MASLSKEKNQEPFLQWAFIGFTLHRNTSKAHQSLPGSKDQTIDNIERTMRLILSQGQLAKWLQNFRKQTHCMLGPLSEN